MKEKELMLIAQIVNFIKTGLAKRKKSYAIMA